MEKDFLKLMQSDNAYVVKQKDFTIDIQMRAKKIMYELNHLPPDDEERKIELLRDLFKDKNLSIGVITPFHCDYGFNIHFEGFAFLNYNCCILDTSPVYIGDGTFIAPGVCISCAGHGVYPSERKEINTSKPIHIGKNVWIGANATILAGVHIGDGSIIGAGSVVSRDIPSNVIAAGVPCKVIREITEKDKINLDVDIKAL